MVVVVVVVWWGEVGGVLWIESSVLAWFVGWLGGLARVGLGW